MYIIILKTNLTSIYYLKIIKKVINFILNKLYYYKLILSPLKKTVKLVTTLI
jgi:hypothetical protein